MINEPQVTLAHCTLETTETITVGIGNDYLTDHVTTIQPIYMLFQGGNIRNFLLITHKFAKSAKIPFII